MCFEEFLHRTLARSGLVLLAAGLAACGSSQQKMDITSDSIATPPHRMSRSEYPFDAAGRYIDAWAAEGSGQYGRRVNTDRTEDGRSEQPEPPERRPLPPPSLAEAPPAPAPRPATTPPRPDLPAKKSTPPRPTEPVKKSTPPATKPAAEPATKPASKTAPKSTTKTPAKKPAAKATPKKPAAKPAAKKKPVSHTVGRGDSLSTIGRRYGVSVQALKKANGLKSDMIKDGRKLVIPKN
jgi:LysM repeat protein